MFQDSKGFKEFSSTKRRC